MRKVRKVKTKKDVLIAIFGALVILLLLDLSPLGGNIVFYARWVSCGSRPVATRLGGGIASPGVPNYVYAPNFGFVRSLTPYFCSETEAEHAGYSARSDRYDFPHLPESEFQDAIQKSKAL